MKIRSPSLLLALSLAFFFLCDTLIFHSGFYRHYMASNDVGTLAVRVHREHERGVSNPKSLLLVGNSQVERGFSGSQFKKMNSDSGIQIFRLDAPKTYEEIWYHALKYADPQRDKYSAILITLPDYKIEPFAYHFGDFQDNYATATFLAEFVPMRDWLDVLSNYKNLSARWRVAKLLLFASHRYAFDLQDFFLDFKNRMQENRDKWSAGDNWSIDPPFIPGAWKDLDIREGKLVACPPGYAQFDCVGGAAEALKPVRADVAARAMINNEASERKWLGKIVDLYANSPTRLYFIQAPRWPTQLPERMPPLSAPDIRNFFAEERNATFLDENLFASLETPVYMHDHVHVSMAATGVFTRILGGEIVKIMNLPRPETASVASGKAP